jgi:hypothetical protein
MPLPYFHADPKMVRIHPASLPLQKNNLTTKKNLLKIVPLLKTPNARRSQVLLKESQVHLRISSMFLPKELVLLSIFVLLVFYRPVT